MKETTRTLKALGKHISGMKGNIKHKTVTTRENWLVFDKGDWSLAMKQNIRNRTYEIFKTGSTSPDFIIPEVYVEEGNIQFTQCRECGHLAVYSDVLAAQHRVQCVEPPEYHSYILEEAKEVE